MILPIYLLLKVFSFNTNVFIIDIQNKLQLNFSLLV